MKNWLVAHALSNIWCQPPQDRRWIIKPARISRKGGELYGMQVSEYSIRLPDTEKWFDVFQIGGLNYEDCGVEIIPNAWTRIDRLVNEYSVLISIYNVTGRTYPLSLTWLRKLPNGNVILAVEQFSTQIKFEREDLYIRFYDGLFKKSPVYNDNYKTSVQSVYVRNVAILNNLVDDFNALMSGNGAPTAYVNGIEVDDLTTSDIKLWDYVDIVHDGLVKSIHYLNVGDLSSFNSKLDNERKFILHPNKTSDEQIDFINDVDLYVIGNNRGRYYHLHTPNMLRQLTHKDYSIPASRIVDFMGLEDSWRAVSDLTVKVIVRHSGLNRPLQFESNRLKELYKLDDSKIVDMMSGVHSLIPEWNGDNLEVSAYNKIMAARYGKVTNVLATEAYGYNAVAKYAADTPTKTQLIGGINTAILPGYLAANCTVYEYNSDGELLEFHNFNSQVSGNYHCQNPDTVLVEAIEGFGSRTLAVDHNAVEFTTQDGINYRYFLNHLKSGVPTDEFEEVTDTDAYEVDNSGKVVWNVDLTRRRPVIISDRNFLTYEFTPDLYTGVIQFTLDHWFDQLGYKPLPFAFETLELWMNGKSLIKDVDYYVKWPEVVICNKEYLENNTNRHMPKITVRARGFKENGRRTDSGFVTDGLISNNGFFNVRDDKVIRITIGGKVVSHDQVLFRENTSMKVDDSLNGLPYSIEDAFIPVRELVSTKGYELSDKAIDLDNRISDYMTNLLPTPVEIEHNPVTKQHHVFSPILNRVIHDLINDILIPVKDSDTFYISTKQFDALMSDYTYLLDYEPSLKNIDERYVVIHPHDGNDMISLTPLQYSLIERINRRYLNNSINLNKHLNVKD